MAEPSDFVESFQDYFEVGEVAQEAGETVIRASLPYSNHEHTLTDTIDVKVTISKELEAVIVLEKVPLVFTECVQVPECLQGIDDLAIGTKKLGPRCSLLDCIDALYLRIEAKTGSRPGRVQVRDFCFPSHDPRHFGHYPPLSPDTVWTECTVQQDHVCNEGLFRKDDRMLVRRPDMIIQDGLFVCRRADDHLPNNHFSIPNYCFRGKE